MTDRLLTPADVSELLSVSEKTLAHWRLNGNGPKYTKLGRAIRYRPTDVDAFVDAGLRQLPRGK